MSEVLTVTDAICIGEILSAAQGNKKVARLIDGSMVHGEARSVGRSGGALAANGDDIRDLFLRVTMPGGVDSFWSVRALMPMVVSGEFVVDFRS